MATSSDPGRILVAVDGEPHTAAAVTWAIGHAGRLGLNLVAVHVKDPYLKQFYNDIYAQGREEYLKHVDDCLAARARESAAELEVAVAGSGLEWEIKVRDGDPLVELLAEIGERRYELVVMGRRVKFGIGAWRSRDLPVKVVARAGGVPVVVVPGEQAEER